jgi:hypothetical protein
MADRDIGSLVVIHHGRLVGIFTERHYARHPRIGSVSLRGGLTDPQRSAL